ncbi:MAG TPA: hypothetical protein ENK85_07455 [Saprospiraceae bacterium]|nr:hypothetical protein [Saprospiraceae bacterium]
MRYFLTGFGLFLLMSLFVRSWYVNTSQRHDIQINQSPITPKGVVYGTPALDYEGSILLEDNYLLKYRDYEEIERVVQALRMNPEAELDVIMTAETDSAKFRRMLSTILTDQAVLETRFHFLRKPSMLTNKFQVLFQVH